MANDPSSRGIRVWTTIRPEVPLVMYEDPTGFDEFETVDGTFGDLKQPRQDPRDRERKTDERVLQARWEDESRMMYVRLDPSVVVMVSAEFGSGEPDEQVLRAREARPASRGSVGRIVFESPTDEGTLELGEPKLRYSEASAERTLRGAIRISDLTVEEHSVIVHALTRVFEDAAGIENSENRAVAAALLQAIEVPSS